MLLKLDDYKARHGFREKRESYQERTARWVKEQISHAALLDTEMDPTNAQKQLGRPLYSNQFEALLKRMEPNLLFEHNPYNASKKMMYIFRNGKKDSICPYENGVMPEFSVRTVKEEEVWDPGQMTKDGALAHFHRADLPKHEWAGPEKGFVFDDTAPRPGFKKVRIPWHEVKRGWRTVLIYLVKHGVFSPAQVEKEFGAANSAGWAGHLGKRPVTTPW